MPMVVYWTREPAFKFQPHSLIQRLVLSTLHHKIMQRLESYAASRELILAPQLDGRRGQTATTAASDQPL